RPFGLGGVLAGIPSNARRPACLVRRVPARVRRTASPRARVHGHLALPEPLRLSGRSRLRPHPSARRDVAQRPDERALGCAVGAAGAPARGNGITALSLPRLARLGRRPAEARARRNPPRPPTPP